MSSPISRQLADYKVAILAAVSEVAENSLYAFADASDQAAFDAAAGANPDGDWLRAGIDFKGPTSGRFVLTVPAALARRLCAAFAGAETPDDIGEADLLDFTGELANMVCGTWLTRACRHDAFNLTPPRVQHVAFQRRDGRRDKADTFYLAIEDTPVSLEIEWDTPVTTASTASRGVPETVDGR